MSEVTCLPFISAALNETSAYTLLLTALDIPAGSLFLTTNETGGSAQPSSVT